jgi:Flp pilus assembly protein protease CpaA
MLLLALIGRGSMGMADVKIAALCGLLLGPQLIIAAITAMTVSAAAVALVLVVTRRAGFGNDLPLVPFMGATTMVFLANGSAVL